MTWVEKYRPKIFSEIRGQNEAIEKVKKFLRDFNLSKLTKTASRKALILHGPPGNGKTTLAYAIAKETKSEVFELNASDLRNSQHLQEILKPAMEQKSLIKQNKIILIDEVDGISTTDRGGLNELLSLIDNSAYPLIITANSIWGKEFSALRKKAELVQLKEIDYQTIKSVLFEILKKENLFLSQSIVTNISVKAKGDIRAAINDLQAVSKLGEEEISELDERNKEVDIFNVMKMIFKGKPTNEMLEIFDSVSMPIDEIMLWIEENISKEYRQEELARAYELLSKADIFKRRIYKQQYWRFLVYENIFLSYGIATSKKAQKVGFTSYKKPTRILKIWMNNQRTEKKSSIAEKYSKYVHVGKKRAMNEFPIIKQIIKSNSAIQRELKLTEGEVNYLINDALKED